MADVRSQPAAVNGNRRYVLISPCRDEARYLRRTVESVGQQTVLPKLWLIVDDGSTDDTLMLLRQYAEKFPFVKVVNHVNRGFRQLGPGVVDVFDFGLSLVDLESYDYVGKFDMDLDLPPRYFERVIEAMEADRSLGCFSGKPYYVDEASGQHVSERVADDHAFGGAKFFRAQCFRDIGGFVRGLGWDAIDSHMCRMLGWRAESADDPDIRFIHLRPMGSSHVSQWTGRVRFGKAQWFMGTSPLYMLAVALHRWSQPPRLMTPMGMLWGYWSSSAKGAPRYDNKTFRAFLRRYQREVLMLGRRRAMERALRPGGPDAPSKHLQ